MGDESDPPEHDGAGSDVDEGANRGAEDKPELLPKHTIFLSHSGAEKPFVEQLCVELEKSHYYPFFDQRSDSLPIGERFSPLITKAAKECLVAVIVLSESFLTSKWPMKELVTFVEATKDKALPEAKRNLKSPMLKIPRSDIPTGANVATSSADARNKKESQTYRDNPNLTLVPLFFKITPNTLSGSLEKLWRKLVKKEMDNNPGVYGSLPSGEDFDETLYAKAEKQLKGSREKPFLTKEQYIGALTQLRGVNGLRFERSGESEVKYRKLVVDRIMELVPRQLPAVDTTGLQGYERLCEVIKGMFYSKKGPSGKHVRQYQLGLFGKAGLGKSTICCEVMFQYFQERFRGRYCRVKMENEKAVEGKSADERGADGKKRQERLKLAIQQLFGMPPKIMSKVMSEGEGKHYLKTQLKLIKQPVFLVVDNVSENSQEEAKWYVNAGLPLGSYVLVTSRSQEILEFVLGGPHDKTVRPFPTLEREEAKQLFLSNAFSNDQSGAAFEPANDTERQILEVCLRKCCIDDQFIPRLLTKFAIFLQTKGDNILSWREYAGDADNTLALEYDNLDDVSKLIYLDLAFFSGEMCFTHMDFHAEMEWDEHSNFKLVVDFIAMLHGIPFRVAEKKVKGLQCSSFLQQSKTQISVSDDYLEFAYSVLIERADGIEKKWCMVCSPDDDNDFVNGMVRVALLGIRFDCDLYKIHKWRTVKFLYIDRVWNLPVLDLQGLRSLRVLRVRECPDLEQIVCTCNSTFSDGHFCYQKERRCLSELRVVQLEYLPKLKDASFPIHSRKLETLWFYECPDVSHFPDLSFCSKLKRLRLPSGDFKGFKGLKSNRELTELAFHWETDTVRNFTKDMREMLVKDVMNLTNLTILDIVDEREVYDWIPEGIHLNVGKLVLLTFLDLSCATTIQEVEGLEQLSHLTSLGLYGCCELRKLPHLSVFKKLKRLCIGHCHKLPSPEGNVPWEDFAESFHALGESCAFGEHKCLDPYLKPEFAVDMEEEGEVEVGDEDEMEAVEEAEEAEEADWEEEDEEEEDEEEEDEEEEDEEDWESDEDLELEEEEDWSSETEGVICKHCNAEGWKSFVAEDSEEPVKDVDVCPRPESSSGGTGASIDYPVRVSEKDKEVISAISTAETQDDISDNSLNILLLGETGVGKSTFINALCNYLKFPTLDEARHGEMQSLIYSEFITANDDGNETRIVIGTPNDDEGASKSVGSSCTQKCKAYTFPIGEKKLIRLVDSPGIGDTRGFDQDMKNIKDILSFISRYEGLNAICILLKPDQERLTTSLRYCILELLAHLHKDASSNIHFCFTNSRRTMFRVGGTKRLLAELLSQSPETAAIKLEKNTMYHFDSEGFRFLACVKNGLDFSHDEADIFRLSWKRSSEEASRLIQQIASLTPHDVQSTLSLNRVRDMLATIETPLAAISAAIQNNLVENRKVMKEFLESHGNLTDKYKNLVIKEEVHEMVPLGHLRTICNSASCQGRFCHAHCSPTETVVGSVLGYLTGDEYVFCKKLSLRKKKCRVCQCPNDFHIRVSHERRSVLREREDESVRKVIDKSAGDIQKMKEISAIYEKRDKAYEDEMKVVVNAAALFSGFLEQNSIITYHPATQEYLKEQIKKKRYSDDHDTPAGKARIAELEGLLETYEKQVQTFKNRRGSRSGEVQRITPEDVKEELKKLYELPRNGECLQILMDDVEREYKLSAIKVDEVAVKMPHVPINKQASPGTAKSLLEKLATMNISTHKKLAD